MLGPSEELAQRHTNIMCAAQKYTILATPFFSEETLRQCNPNLVPSISLTGNERYSSLHAEKQAEYLEVFQVVPADLWQCLGANGSPWFRNEVIVQDISR